MLLAHAEGLATLFYPGIARVAEMAQRVEGWRVGRRIRAQGREHVRPHRAAQVRAIAAPVVRYQRRPIERLALEIEGLVVAVPG